MKCVGEHDISEDPAGIVVAEVNRGIELEVASEIAGETDGRRILLAALEIDLYSPGFIEIVGVTENQLVLIAGMNRADHSFVMLAVIAGLDVRLRIDMEMW